MSLGFSNAGFQCLAAIDSDHAAVETMRANFRDGRIVLEEDLTVYSPASLERLLGTRQVSVIVGGPPCQGFSVARQRDGTNHGERLVVDPRRLMYVEFLKFVEYFRPPVFVMENVLGIKSAAGGRYFSDVQAKARSVGYRVHSEEIRAWRFGVPQKRIRQLIIGTREDFPIFSGELFIRETHCLLGEEKTGRVSDAVSLWEAIGDLPPREAGSGADESTYDLPRRAAHLGRYGPAYLEKILQISKSRRLTGHVARHHSARDLRDFARLREGENSGEALARGEKMEFPYDRNNFKDRFTRQHRNRLCSTIVAHLAKDGLMFIHPTQQRSLTPREAARIQSFPDWFTFPRSRTQAFQLIGNAVPPLVGLAVGKGVAVFLASSKQLNVVQYAPLIPVDNEQALARLLLLLKSPGASELRSLDALSFRLGWFSAGYLFRRLHPDSAVGNGDDYFVEVQHPSIPILLRPLVGRMSVRSGWPEGLLPIAREARRRFEEGSLRSGEYYFSAAQIASPDGQIPLDE